jgi:hypothetical protein
MATSKSLIETLSRCQSLVAERTFDVEKKEQDILNLQFLINLFEVGHADE